MDNRIFVIHASEIIRQGLFGVAKDLFGMEAVLLASCDELKNYHEIANARLILLVDAGLDQDHFSRTIKLFHTTNTVKIILIREASEKSNCSNTCDCCFSINAPKARIFDLLNPYLKSNNRSSEKRNASWLTEREIDVLKLVAFGKTNKEIADQLCISFHTVISHRKNITEKLGIKSISGLTVYAILNNLIDATSMDPESLI